MRGDVIALDFTQTTIMGMGQPPPVQQDEPAMWVRSRQHTGRIVTVSNAVIFDEPVYNYTREFPFIWEEMSVPVGDHADHARAERILLVSTRRPRTSSEPHRELEPVVGESDAMSRDILQALDAAGIGVASATFEVVGVPPLRIDAPWKAPGA